MNDLRDNSDAIEFLNLLWNARDHQAGIPIVDLPSHLRAEPLMTLISAEGLIEFGRRNHCHVGAGEHKKLILENGWSFASLNSPGKKRVRDLLQEALTEQVPQEIRHHVRLTAKGDAEASRLQLARDANATSRSTDPIAELVIGNTTLVGSAPVTFNQSLLEELIAAFAHFSAKLEATTVPASDDARRVAGFSHAIALSEASDALSVELSLASQQLFRDHGRAMPDMSAALSLEESGSPNGPSEPIPSGRVSITGMQVGGEGADALLMAALESASRIVSFSLETWNAAQARNPGANHQRWQAGDLIGAEELAELKCASNLLKLYQRGRFDTRTAQDKAQVHRVNLATAPKAEKESSREIRGESQPFNSGELVYFGDRVELCGIDICSGPRSRSRRIALELLSRRRKDGSFVAYSGDDLEVNAKQYGAKGTAAGWIRDLRDDIIEFLQNQKNIVCGNKDVILSGDSGYRFSDRVTVQFADPPTIKDITDITDTDGTSDVPNDDVRDVFDVRDDAVGARQAWILQRLAEGARLKAPNVAEQFKCSVKTAQRDLTTLKDGGKIEFVGAARTGYYRLCQTPKQRP